MEDRNTDSKNGCGNQKDEEKIYAPQLLHVRGGLRNTSECSHNAMTTSYCFSVLGLRACIHKMFQLAGPLHDEAAGYFPESDTGT